jgi:hypothetical protein
MICLSTVDPDLYTSHSQLSIMLNKFPMLTHLIVHCKILDHWEHTAIIHLPILHLLHIQAVLNNDEEEVSGLVMMISAPLLHSLILEGVTQPDFNLLFESSDPRHPSLHSQSRCESLV